MATCREKKAADKAHAKRIVAKQAEEAATCKINAVERLNAEMRAELSAVTAVDERKRAAAWQAGCES